MPQVNTIKFYLSGLVPNNANPFDSQGGPISTVSIMNNILNNLWDDISSSVQKQGGKSYRLIYVKNEGGTTLSNLRLFFNNVDNYTGIAIPSEGKNVTIPPIPEPPEEDPNQKSEETQHRIIFDNQPQAGYQTIRLDDESKAIAETIWGVRTTLYNHQIASVTAYAKKIGNPTGSFGCRIRGRNGEEKQMFQGAVDASTLSSTQYSPVNFTMAAHPTYQPDVFDFISFEYAFGSSSNCVEMLTHPVDTSLSTEVMYKLDFETGGEAFGDINAKEQFHVDENGMFDENSPNGTDVCFTATTLVRQCVSGGDVPDPTQTQYYKPMSYDESNLLMPALNAGDYHGVWMERNIPAETPSSADQVVELIVMAG